MLLGSYVSFIIYCSSLLLPVAVRNFRVLTTEYTSFDNTSNTFRYLYASKKVLTVIDAHVGLRCPTDRTILTSIIKATIASIIDIVLNR